MDGSAIRYAPAMLARLTYCNAAHELAEQLVSAAATYADGYGRGAFMSEEAATILSGAAALLDAAVVADRLRGASWTDVGEALDLSAAETERRFGDGERTFRESVLFPHRAGPHGGLGYTTAPYAVEEPDRVRERLDAWVVKQRRSSGPQRDEPEPVTPVSPRCSGPRSPRGSARSSNYPTL